MDYIQQAIDKAREKRDGRIGNVDNRKPRVPMSQSVVNKEPVDGVPEQINYTKTKRIPLNEAWLKKQRIVTTSSANRRGEPYRRLRTQILQKLRANNWKTLAVTSPNRGAGKTTTAVNLAVSLSKEVNQTVMLVDLDMREAGVIRAFGIKVDHGLMDHLNGDCSVGEILINPELERLVLLPSKKDSRYSSEILSSPAMKRLIDDLTTRYESRIIVFDLPALLENDDALTFIPAVDCALLVVEDGKTTLDDIDRSMKLLEGTSIIGTILNKVIS